MTKSNLWQDILIAETDWPEACSGVSLSANIPVSASGQQTWVRDIESVLEGLGSRGLGVVYWEPGWIGNAGLGSSCSVNRSQYFYESDRE